MRAKEWHSYRVIAGVHDAAQLVEGCLRVAPDRIIVGEVRGAEINSMLEAWGTGHPGGICTIHSDTATPIQALAAGGYAPAQSQSGPDSGTDRRHHQPDRAHPGDLAYATPEGTRFRRLVPEVVNVLGFEHGKYELERVA